MMFWFAANFRASSEDIVVRLEEDDGDVDILLNGKLVAFFDGDDGTLRLTPLKRNELPIPTEKPNGGFRRLKVAGYEIK